MTEGEGFIGQERRRAERRAPPPHIHQLLARLRIEMRRPGAKTTEGEYRAVPLVLLEDAVKAIESSWRVDT